MLRVIAYLQRVGVFFQKRVGGLLSSPRNRKVLKYGVLLLCILYSGRFLPKEPFQSYFGASRGFYAADGTLLRLTLAPDEQYRLWVSLPEVSPDFVDAVLLKEDQYFYWHWGVNPIALWRAGVSTFWSGNQQGASTITMQLARRMYGNRDRTIWGKVRQLTSALWIEWRYSKAEILEAYINSIPMGGNIEGVEAASILYFDKPSKTLDLSQALFLSVLPQSPTIRNQQPERLQTAYQRLLTQWREQYPLDVRTPSLLPDFQVIKQERQERPFLAPHYVDYLLQKFPQQQTYHTTLSMPLQQLLERSIQQYIQKNKFLGIRNAHAVLVDNEQQAVVAWVGSAQYFDESIHGQVNGVRARRSPGSTLKPFLYALALDAGLIHPMTLLKDTATSFGHYQPENFDGQFIGPIRAQDALIRSRNVPAVLLASQLPKYRMYHFLQEMGVQKLKSASFYGLSLVLGGGEVSAEELVQMYMMLANRGVQYPLRYLSSDPLSNTGTARLSAAASFIVQDMLRANPRPDGLPVREGYSDWHPAWKTGTSWGFHDAWTAGIVGKYSLVVWVGNFDGEANNAFVGLKAAAPLFFQIADALPRYTPDWQAAHTIPTGVERVDICAASGEFPNAWCPLTKKTWFIAGVSPITTSQLHQPVWMDKQTGAAVCPPYLPEVHQMEVFEFWPSDILSLFKQAGLEKPSIPSIQCASNSVTQKLSPPTITSPLKSRTYVIRRGQNAIAIPLKSVVAPQVNTVYWYVNQSFLGSSPRDQLFTWQPTVAGEYWVTVMDDAGASDSRLVTVEWAF